MNKDEQIRWMNSLTNATNSVSLISDGDSMAELKEKIEEMANWYYKVSPRGSELEAKIRACNNRQELDLLKKDVEATQDKSIFSTFNDKILEINSRESLSK